MIQTDHRFEEFNLCGISIRRIQAVWVDPFIAISVSVRTVSSGMFDKGNWRDSDLLVIVVLLDAFLPRENDVIYSVLSTLC